MKGMRTTLLLAAMIARGGYTRWMSLLFIVLYGIALYSITR
jgi:hypothetical protein